MNITQVPAASGNFGLGRAGSTVKFIVMHWMAGTIAGADARFTKPGTQVSAHYGISQNGIVHQYVKENDTAYHAGNLAANRSSIGIEHEGGPAIPITDSVYQTSAELVRALCAKFNLPINRTTIRKHNEFTATACPGTLDLDRIIALANQSSMNLSLLKGKCNNPRRIRDTASVVVDVAIPSEAAATEMGVDLSKTRVIDQDFPGYDAISHNDLLNYIKERLQPELAEVKNQLKVAQEALAPVTEERDRLRNLVHSIRDNNNAINNS